MGKDFFFCCTFKGMWTVFVWNRVRTRCKHWINQSQSNTWAKDTESRCCDFLKWIRIWMLRTVPLAAAYYHQTQIGFKPQPALWSVLLTKMKNWLLKVYRSLQQKHNLTGYTHRRRLIVTNHLMSVCWQPVIYGHHGSIQPASCKQCKKHCCWKWVFNPMHCWFPCIFAVILRYSTLHPRTTCVLYHKVK